eukprot:TRINITY_DN267_c0_g1_i1.p1 TRINITY_DN267_c0_g1~~TRINITY_DN267_c0_g1_i1.p1  ORF type:complete len:1313 (-),score=248.23 TRINITY_DN267_c0_g1_i1:378-4316(-)
MDRSSSEQSTEMEGQRHTIWLVEVRLLDKDGEKASHDALRVASANVTEEGIKNVQIALVQILGVPCASAEGSAAGGGGGEPCASLVQEAEAARSLECFAKLKMKAFLEASEDLGQQTGGAGMQVDLVVESHATRQDGLCAVASRLGAKRLYIGERGWWAPWGVSRPDVAKRCSRNLPPGCSVFVVKGKRRREVERRAPPLHQSSTSKRSSSIKKSSSIPPPSFALASSVVSQHLPSSESACDGDLACASLESFHTGAPVPPPLKQRRGLLNLSVPIGRLFPVARGVSTEALSDETSMLSLDRQGPGTAALHDDSHHYDGHYHSSRPDGRHGDCQNLRRDNDRGGARDLDEDDDVAMQGDLRPMGHGGDFLLSPCVVAMSPCTGTSCQDRCLPEAQRTRGLEISRQLHLSNIQAPDKTIVRSQSEKSARGDGGATDGPTNDLVDAENVVSNVFASGLEECSDESGHGTHFFWTGGTGIAERGEPAAGFGTDRPCDDHSSYSASPDRHQNECMTTTAMEWDVDQASQLSQVLPPATYSTASPPCHTMSPSWRATFLSYHATSPCLNEEVTGHSCSSDLLLSLPPTLARSLSTGTLISHITSHSPIGTSTPRGIQPVDYSSNEAWNNTSNCLLPPGQSLEQQSELSGHSALTSEESRQHSFTTTNPAVTRRLLRTVRSEERVFIAALPALEASTVSCVTDDSRQRKQGRFLGIPRPFSAIDPWLDEERKRRKGETSGVANMDLAEVNGAGTWGEGRLRDMQQRDEQVHWDFYQQQQQQQQQRQQQQHQEQQPQALQKEHWDNQQQQQQQQQQQEERGQPHRDSQQHQQWECEQQRQQQEQQQQQQHQQLLQQLYQQTTQQHVQQPHLLQQIHPQQEHWKEPKPVHHNGEQNQQQQQGTITTLHSHDLVNTKPFINKVQHHISGEVTDGEVILPGRERGGAEEIQEEGEVEECWEGKLSDEAIKAACQGLCRANVIGDGAYSTVYRAEVNGRAVAVKLFRKRCDHEKELALVAGLRHPRIVPLLGSCASPPCLFYEYLPHGDLECNLKGQAGRPPLTWRERLRVFDQICCALQHLHSRAEAIIHYDIKPPNVVLDADLNAKLTDLGLADHLPLGQLCQSKDSPVGTYWYCDPYSTSVDEWGLHSDIYSLGQLLWDLLIGPEQAKQAGTLGRMSQAVRDGANERLRELLDPSAGEWPADVARQLAELAVACTRVDLGEDVCRPRVEEILALVRQVEGRWRSNGDEGGVVESEERRTMYDVSADVGGAKALVRREGTHWQDDNERWGVIKSGCSKNKDIMHEPVETTLVQNEDALPYL